MQHLGLTIFKYDQKTRHEINRFKLMCSTRLIKWVWLR